MAKNDHNGMFGETACEERRESLAQQRARDAAAARAATDVERRFQEEQRRLNRAR